MAGVSVRPSCSNIHTTIGLRADQVLTRINLAVAADPYKDLYWVFVHEPTVSHAAAFSA